MIKRKSIIVIILLLISFIQIEEVTPHNNHIKKQTQSIITKREKQEIIEEPIASLNIPKIDLYKPLYKKESKKNNIEENVTILKESTNHQLILAAHSGNSSVSFFDRLDELTLEDTIYIKDKEQTYTYSVTKIKEVEKNGKLFLVQDDKKTQIVLTTCSPNQEGKQLVVIATKK